MDNRELESTDFNKLSHEADPSSKGTNFVYRVDGQTECIIPRLFTGAIATDMEHKNSGTQLLSLISKPNSYRITSDLSLR